jgi:small basic protein
MWLLLGFVVGILIGYYVPFHIPMIYSKYVAVAFLAALDSVLGGSRAGMEKRFDTFYFILGFLTNAFLAALLTFVGDQLGVDLYLAAIVTFGVRIFQNLALIRQDLTKRGQTSATEKNPLLGVKS